MTVTMVNETVSIDINVVAKTAPVAFIDLGRAPMGISIAYLTQTR